MWAGARAQHGGGWFRTAALWGAPPGARACQQPAEPWATQNFLIRLMLGLTEFGALHISWSDGTKQTISPQRMGGRRSGSGRALIGGGGGPCRSGRRGPQQLPAKGLPLLAADVGLGNDLEVLGPQHRGLVCDATRRVTSGRSHQAHARHRDSQASSGNRPSNWCRAAVTDLSTAHGRNQPERGAQR